MCPEAYCFISYYQKATYMTVALNLELDSVATNNAVLFMSSISLKVNSNMPYIKMHTA